MIQHKPRLRRSLTILAAAATAALVAPAVAPLARAANGFKLDRYAGQDRYDTAALIATGTFSTADSAVVASGENFPDALAASYLAGSLKAPILLTHAASVPSQTLAALQTLKTRNVTIVGGPQAVSTDVQNQLAGTQSSSSAGGNLAVTRLGGNDRFDTARLVAEQPGTTGVGLVGGNPTAILVSGANFPDAVSVGPLADAAHLPVLLTDPQSLSTTASQAMDQLGIKLVLIAGGTVAVSGNVESQVKSAGRATVRFAGGDRMDTASRVADWALQSLKFKNTHVNVSRGDDFADALAGAVHGGAELAPTLLTGDPNTLGGATQDWLQGRSATLATGHVFGGTAAVAQATSDAATKAASAAGPVVLASSTVAQGGTIKGQVSGVNSLNGFTVSGCRISSTPVSPDAGGFFSVTIPAATPSATCTLTFVITRTDNTTTNQTITITITTSTPVSTSAPDLLSATIDKATGNVTYAFDKNIAQFGQGQPSGSSGSPTPAASAFHVYQANGNEVTATSVSISGKTVVATYPGQPGGASPALAATLATINQDAVEGDTAGTQKSPECGVALQDVKSVGGVPATPNLIAVQLSGTPATAAAPAMVTGTFSFDQAVTAQTVSSSGFELILDDSTIVTNTNNNPQPDTTAKVWTVTFKLSGTKTSANVVRAGVTKGTVSGASGSPLGNPRQALPAPNTNGQTTNGPDLTGVAVQPVLGAADFTFDKPVSTPQVNDQNFFVLAQTDGGEITGSATPIVLSPTTLRVYFPPNALPNAVGASVYGGGNNGAARVGSGTGAVASVLAYVSLPQFAIPAGATGLPDLVAVTVSSTLVTFGFDKPVPSGQLAVGNFQLYDAKANQGSNAVSGTPEKDTTMIDFPINASQPSPFGSFAVAQAVAGGVHDSSQKGTSPGGPQYPMTASQPSALPGGSLLPEGCQAVAAPASS